VLGTQAPVLRVIRHNKRGDPQDDHQADVGRSVLIVREQCGRIKDMFKTSGGKYIVPPAIEEKFIALCPYASQFVVFGEDRNFCVALIALDADVTASWAADRA
jgi:hypothetical protein